MSNVSISKDKKASILEDVRTGRSFEQFYFPFLGAEPDFAKELVDLAIEVDNQVFLHDVEKFIEARDAKAESTVKPGKRRETKRPNYYSSKYKKYTKGGKLKKKYNIRPNTKFKRSANYAPTGKSLDDYLKEKGIDLSPKYKRPWVQFVSGGLPGLGKR